MHVLGAQTRSRGPIGSVTPCKGPVEGGTATDVQQVEHRRGQGISARLSCKGRSAAANKEGTATHVQEFLLQSGRIIRSIIADGNCFFRTVSCHLLGDECEHNAVRTLYC